MVAATLAVVMAWLPVRNKALRTAIAAATGTGLGAAAFNLVATYMVTGKLGKAASVSILGFLPGVVAGLAMGAMTQPQTKLN
jgi:hypothetical protein